jgi:hypothetical protein
LEISEGDTFTWLPEPKNKYLSLSILDHDDSENLVANYYLIKDDGQFIIPHSIIQSVNAEYVDLSFSRNLDKNILCSDGNLIRLMTLSESFGLFRIKKAAQ